MRAARKLIPPIPKTLQNNFSAWSRSYPAYSHSSNTEIISTRVEELRKRLKEDGRNLLSGSNHIFEISERGKDFLEEVNSNLNKKYSRGGKNGEGYVGVDEVVEMVANSYYDGDEKEALSQLSSQVQDRMRVKVSKSYLDHALKVPEGAKEPNPILKIVMPDVQEVSDMNGESDPSNQNRYSPLPGLLHKYEMLLAFVSVNCSSHCRYCYRLDLFSGISNKSKADMPVIAAYIKTFNTLIDDTIKESGKRDEKTGLWLHKETGEPLIHVKEILFSGGDPMTLPNSTIARYMSLMAEAGINTVRIGTKELAFNPERFDSKFWEMMDLFHETYPEVKVDIVGHYSHPHELVEAKIDRNGKYLYDTDLNYRVRKDLKAPLAAMNERRDWIGHANQFPIISGINDSPDVLRLLIYQTCRLGMDMHNIYACREIMGNKHFRGENTIEAQYQLVEQSKVGLSGLKNHARLIMSTEYGKVEVCGVEKEDVILKFNRFIHGNRPENNIIRVGCDKLSDGKKFYWLTQDVIDSAVSGEGRKILEELKDESGSLIKHLKQISAESVLSRIPQNDNEERVTNSCSQKVTIEVVNRNGGSKTIEVNLADKKYEKQRPTLATVLAENGEVEAACKEQLSCSTCVGEVESDNKLPKATEDELDLIDSVTKSLPSSSIEPRAGCKIPLSKGYYKFTKSQ